MFKDQRLIDAQSVYGCDWKKIAGLLNINSFNRVGKRWRMYLCPEQKIRNQEPWTNNEVNNFIFSVFFRVLILPVSDHSIT